MAQDNPDNVAAPDAVVHLPFNIAQNIGLWHSVLAVIVVGLSVFNFAEVYVL